MRTGFSFKGQNSSEFKGMVIKSDDRPVRPEMKDSTISASNAHGEQSFAAANPYKHEYYNDRIFQMSLQISASDIYDLQSKITKLSRWIMGEGELIFDDSKFIRWWARIVDMAQFTPEHKGKTAVIVIKYRVKPFSELIFDTQEGPCLDMDIPLDSDMPLDIGKYFSFTGAGQHAVKNISDICVRPIITVTDATKEYSIECNGFKLTIPKSAVIDCEKYTVTDLSGNNLMPQVTGDFFELLQGDNIMTVTTSEEITIAVKYNPKYINSVDIRNIGLE